MRNAYLWTVSVAMQAGVAVAALDHTVSFPKLSAFDKVRYDDIFAPRVVGVPPENAYRSLSLRPGG